MLKPRTLQATLLIAILRLLPPASWAADFDVTRFDDPTPDGCLPGDCSLREAVIDANTSVEGDDVHLPAGTYTLSIPGLEEDAAATGDLDITAELTVLGAGSRTTVIDGGGLDRVFQIFASAGSVNLADITLRNGGGDGAGAGLFNGGASLTVTRCTFVDNSTSSFGGGILGSGPILIVDSTLSGNQADRGGGIYQSTDTATVVNSTISGNFATSFGGGILPAVATAGFVLRSVTITGNTADANNDGFGNGGGISLFNGTIEIGHTIVAGNIDLGGEVPDCEGGSDLISAGYNLIGDTSGCAMSGDATGNVIDVDPLLSPLSDHGGSTDTHTLMDGSAAIDAGNPAGCPDENDQPLATDQRGAPRPTDGDGDSISICDMGAVEIGDSIFADGFESGDVSAWSSSVP